MKRVGTVAVLSLLLTSVLRAQADPAGTWTGYWTRAGDTLPVTMVVRSDTGGRYSAVFASERLRVRGVPFTSVTTSGCCGVTLVLRGDRTTATFRGLQGGDSLTGSFDEAGTTGRFAFARSAATPPTFDEQDITFANGAVTLAGTILLPAGTGHDRVPGVVFLHGSGPERRWASRYLAEQLARNGFACLIFDKRGVGGSTGRWQAAGLDDLAADGAAAVARLRQEARVDPDRVGILGHSQGGTLAPMVAVKSGSVAFVIGSAAAGIPMDSVEIYSIGNAILPNARSATDSSAARDYVGELVSVAYHGRSRARLDSLMRRDSTASWYFRPPAPDDPYWTFSRQFASFRPADWWPRVRVPVLLVYGAMDQRVPPESAGRISEILHRAGNQQVTMQIHPGADHTFRLRPGPSGWPATAPGYVPGLLAWLRGGAGSGGGQSSR